VTDSSEIIKEQELIKQLGMELTKGNMLDPETLIDLVTATGLTRMKEDVKTSLAKKRKENDQIGKLSQQLEQLQQQAKQLEQENQKLQQQVNRNNETKIQLDQERLQFDKELGWYEAQNLKEYNEAKLEEGLKRVQLEAIQLLDNNGKNDEIRNE
jgi:parvulin-like peptidyl-prolyl isomerase